MTKIEKAFWRGYHASAAKSDIAAPDFAWGGWEWVAMAAAAATGAWWMAPYAFAAAWLVVM
jgi:hypothetical protein